MYQILGRTKCSRWRAPIQKNKNVIEIIQVLAFLGLAARVWVWLGTKVRDWDRWISHGMVCDIYIHSTNPTDAALAE
jgi:hypothetical protein